MARHAHDDFARFRPHVIPHACHQRGRWGIDPHPRRSGWADDHPGRCVEPYHGNDRLHGSRSAGRRAGCGHRHHERRQTRWHHAHPTGLGLHDRAEGLHHAFRRNKHHHPAGGDTLADDPRSGRARSRPRWQRSDSNGLGDRRWRRRHFVFSKRRHHSGAHPRTPTRHHDRDARRHPRRDWQPPNLWPAQRSRFADQDWLRHVDPRWCEPPRRCHHRGGRRARPRHRQPRRCLCGEPRLRGDPRAHPHRRRPRRQLGPQRHSPATRNLRPNQHQRRDPRHRHA